MGIRRFALILLLSYKTTMDHNGEQQYMFSFGIITVAAIEAS